MGIYGFWSMAAISYLVACVLSAFCFRFRKQLRGFDWVDQHNLKEDVLLTILQSHFQKSLQNHGAVTVPW